MIKSISVLGSSSGRNAGDAALISGIMEAVDQRLNRRVRYEIPTLYPDFVTRTYTDHDVCPINVMPWTGSIKLMGIPTYRSVTRTDMSLVFDAVLFDRDLFNPMFNFLSSLYVLLPAAKRAGKRVGLYNCGVGPIKTKLGAKMLKKVADVCDFITVREEGSADVLLDLGVPKDRIILTADAALNAPAVSPAETERLLAEIGINKHPEVLAININIYLDTWAEHSSGKLTKESFLDIMAKGINDAAAQISAPILFVTTMHKDIELTQALKDRIKCEQPIYIIDNKQYNHYQLKGIFSHISLLYAMRLHAIILASSAGAPVAGLAYQPKVTHYFEQLGLQDYCNGFKGFSPAAVTEQLVKAWTDRHKIKATLDQKIPELKQKAFIAAECVAQFDQDQSACDQTKTHCCANC
jgi:polysaccharide pyruvyl transferase WcaK-like protein